MAHERSFVISQGKVADIDPFSGATSPPIHSTRSAIGPLPAVTEWRTRTPDPVLRAGLRANCFDWDAELSDPDDGRLQFALSRKFGRLYPPVLEPVSLVANYQNGFYQGAPTAVAEPDGSNPRLKAFEPEPAFLTCRRPALAQLSELIGLSSGAVLAMRK